MSRERILAVVFVLVGMVSRHQSQSAERRLSFPSITASGLTSQYPENLALTVHIFPPSILL